MKDGDNDSILLSDLLQVSNVMMDVKAFQNSESTVVA